MRYMDYKYSFNDLAPIKEKLLSRAEKQANGCWVWKGGVVGGGYGTQRVNGEKWLVHRLSYLVFVGDISNYRVLHRCDNPPCINPAHLFLGTDKDNVRDSMTKGRRADVRGVKNGVAKIDDATVSAIRLDLKSGKVQRLIAAKHGVCQMTVSLINQRKIWKHVP